MPTVGTSIRDDDYSEYEIIKNAHRGSWSEFIHKALDKHRNQRLKDPNIYYKGVKQTGDKTK